MDSVIQHQTWLMANGGISRFENEKGLSAYILYMHVAPFHSQPQFVRVFMSVAASGNMSELKGYYDF